MKCNDAIAHRRFKFSQYLESSREGVHLFGLLVGPGNPSCCEANSSACEFLLGSVVCCVCVKMLVRGDVSFQLPS